MTTPIRFSLIAAVTSAFLSTSALIPASGIAAVSPEDAGVSMTVKPGLGEAPKLKMITRGDIQGESFFANPFEVIDLLLTDGTTLTMAAGTSMVVDRYAYDPGTRSGELATTLEQGTLRVIGGTLNNTQPIAVSTPAGLFYLDNAAVVIVVEADGSTRAVLEYGKSLTLITEDGEEIQIVRPGFEVRIAADGTVSGPVRRAEGDAIEIARLLNPGLVTDVPPAIGVEDSATDGDDDEEQTAQLPGDEDGDPTDPIEDDLTETEPETPEFDFDGAGGDTDAGSGFEAGETVGTIDTVDFLPTQSNAQRINLSQNDAQISTGTDQNGFPTFDPASQGTRAYGLTTTRIFNGGPTNTSIIDNDREGGSPIEPLPETETGFELPGAFENTQYIFNQNGGFIIGNAASGSVENFSSGNIIPVGLFYVGNFPNDPISPSKSGVVNRNLIAPQIVSSVVGTLRGTIIGSALYSFLQEGFSQGDFIEFSGISEPREVLRADDNFLILEADPVLASDIGVKVLLELLALQSSNEATAALVLATFGLQPIDENGNSIFSDDAFVLAEGLVEALKSDDPAAAVAKFLHNVKLESALTQDEIDQAVRQFSRREQFVFAAGDVDADPDETRRLDTFYITPGLEGFDEDGSVPEGARVAESIRAFLRNATDLRDEEGKGGVAIGDSGLMIIGTPALSTPDAAASDDPAIANQQSGLLHADIGMDGEGASQRSTVSVTIGHVQYDVDVAEADPFN